MQEKENILQKGFSVANRFEIQFPIGSNSFAQSYRAKDASGKIIRLDLINLASLPSSYFDENGKLLQLNLLKQINHNNIPKLLNEGETIIEKQKFAFLAYEFVSGETLTERLKREATLSPYTAIPIIIELLEAIEYLHNQSDPIIHNGINPNTIKLDYSLKRDKPILTGFEQARSIHQNGQSVSIKYLSVFHSAPELLNGIFIPQSDLFSIGAVLYHLLFGVPPFFNENILNQPINKQKGLLEAARNKPLNFSLADENLIDEQIKNTLAKALSIEIESRFQTAEDFSKALKREVLLESKKLPDSHIFNFEKKEKQPGTGFDAIAGMQSLKDKLKEEIIDLLEDKEGAEAYGISIPNGMLLYGPPRCGKTFFAEKFAEEAGYNYKFIKSSDLASIYIHGSQEKIGELFKEARKNAPMILCFDEIDALVPSRDKLNNASQSGEVNEFLTQLNNCGKDGVFVIGTTNFPQGIDIAVLGAGRLDLKVFVPMPDFEARKAMFKLYLKNKPIEFGIDYDKLAELTNNYASSDIVAIINQTGLKLRKSRNRITQNSLELVISETIPSVSREEVNKYDLLRERFENRGLKNETKRRPLGFHLPNNE
jgi:transitional endoplasmic reticulum ATPase